MAIQPKQLSQVLFYEQNLNYSREQVQIEAGQNLELGTVLGAVLSATATAGANTGDGVVGAITFEDQAQTGDYKLVCTAVALNAGTFSIETPQGYFLSDLTVGVAYISKHINLTIADGAADFILGDSFSISVSNTSHKAMTATATDGSQIAAAVLLDATDATSAAKNAGGLVRSAIVNNNGLVWDASITTQLQRDTALAQLSRAGIINKTGI